LISRLTLPAILLISGVAAAPGAFALAGTSSSAQKPAPSTSSAKPAIAPAGAPVFPSAVDPKYSKLSAGKAREQTCLDQYHANKSNGGNAAMKWIQKGGGYYSACSKHLKAAK
jgi:hypothetical protein